MNRESYNAIAPSWDAARGRSEEAFTPNDTADR
jgi:hypothetical protein